MEITEETLIPRVTGLVLIPPNTTCARCMAPIWPNQAGIINEVEPRSTGTVRVFVADEDGLFNLTRLLGFSELKHANQYLRVQSLGLAALGGGQWQLRQSRLADEMKEETRAYVPAPERPVLPPTHSAQQV